MIRILLFWFALLVAPFAWADPVDINTADLAALDTLPGIGPAKAAAIIAHRDANGPFATVDALGDVTGIGPATIAGLRDFVLVGAGGAAPAAVTQAANPSAPAPAPAAPAASGARVNINSANATQLQDLPGIGPTKAAAIVADRGENGPFATCSDLGRVLGIGPATLAGLADHCTTE